MVCRIEFGARNWPNRVRTSEHETSEVNRENQGPNADYMFEVEFWVRCSCRL